MDQVNDAGLQRGRWKHDSQHFGHAFDAIGHGDQEIVDAACLEIVEHLHLELGALTVLDSQAQDIACTVGQNAERKVDRLLHTTASSRILIAASRRTPPDTSAQAAGPVMPSLRP